jgi:hypothetical protein
MSGEVRAAFEAALALSHRLLAAAEQADLPALRLLDTERMRLLESIRRGARPDAGERAMLGEVARLNDRAIGLMQHHLRRKARELDMAAVGRRAVAAYATAGR